MIFTLDTADARLTELQTKLREIRLRIGSDDPRFIQVRRSGEDMIMLYDAWFAAHQTFPRDAPISDIWTSELEHVSNLVNALHREVVGGMSPFLIGLAVLVLGATGLVFYKTTYGGGLAEVPPKLLKDRNAVFLLEQISKGRTRLFVMDQRPPGWLLLERMGIVEPSERRPQDKAKLTSYGLEIAREMGF